MMKYNFLHIMPINISREICILFSKFLIFRDICVLVILFNILLLRSEKINNAQNARRTIGLLRWPNNKRRHTVKFSTREGTSPNSGHFLRDSDTVVRSERRSLEM